MYSEEKNDQRKSIVRYCNDKLTKKSFTSSTKDYILSLPDYKISHSSSGAKYRVIAVVRHKKDSNDYYSFSTLEVVK